MNFLSILTVLISFTSKNWWPFLSHRLPCPYTSETTPQVPDQTSLHQSTDLYTNATLWSPFLTNTMFIFPLSGTCHNDLLGYFLHMLAIIHTLHISPSTLCTIVPSQHSAFTTHCVPYICNL